MRMRVFSACLGRTAFVNHRETQDLHGSVMDFRGSASYNPPAGPTLPAGSTSSAEGTMPNVPETPRGESAPAEKSHLLSPPSLSLPKGGGAIKGIDEKFAVN